MHLRAWLFQKSEVLQTSSPRHRLDRAASREIPQQVRFSPGLRERDWGEHQADSANVRATNNSTLTPSKRTLSPKLARVPGARQRRVDITPQYLNFKLTCPKCGVIYLNIPDDVSDSTVIRCSQCNTPRGTWQELETSFIRQSGRDGVFEMDEGQIIRKD